MPSVLAKLQSDVEFGSARVHKGMRVVPILNRRPSPRNYLTASEALHRGGFRVTEISSEGSVPELAAINDLDIGVLLIDGEEFAGAKQNRVVNLSIFLAARSSLTLPVSCVEAGRWEEQSSSMETSGDIDALPVRRKRIHSVMKSTRRHEGFQSDQAEVWESITDVLCEVGADSSTDALRDAYVASSDAVADFERTFTPEIDQTGALIATNGRWTSLELFAHPDVYAAHAGKIIRSNALGLNATFSNSTVQPPDFEANSVLKEIAQTLTDQPSVIGSGMNLRFESTHWFGSALEVDDEAIHLVAYAK